MNKSLILLLGLCCCSIWAEAVPKDKASVSWIDAAVAAKSELRTQLEKSGMPVVSRLKRVKQKAEPFEVELNGSEKLILITDGGRDGTDHDQGIWGNARLIKADGTEVWLDEVRYEFGKAGWGNPTMNTNAHGQPIKIAGKPYKHGAHCHAQGMLIYNVKGYERFVAEVGVDDSSASGSVYFKAMNVLPDQIIADLMKRYPEQLGILGSYLGGLDTWMTTEDASVERELVNNIVGKLKKPAFFKNQLKQIASEPNVDTQIRRYLENATWTDLDGSLKVPVFGTDAAGFQHGKIENVNVDLAEYAGKPFYVALKYELPPLDPTLDESGITAHPDAFFSPKLVQTIDGRTLERDNPKEDFGFGFCCIHANSGSDNPTVTIVDDRKVTINGRKSSAQGTYVWAISQKLTPAAVNPDEGISIKNASFDLKSYTYIYNELGEYTVTFVARNANAWGYKEQIKEVTIKVVEPSQEEEEETME